MNIHIEDLKVSYNSDRANILAIEGLHLEVSKGKVLALVGESGCGKSTLLRVLAGVINEYSGTVTIGSERANPRQQKIGYLQQNYGLLPWKTVEENIVLGAKIRNYNGYKANLEELLDKLGLSEYRLRYPHELSGGQQQRVGLARAYLLKPDVLLMDEPFSALDILTRETMHTVFLELRQWQPVTTVLVTHYIEEAIALGDKIAIMAKPTGKIAEIIDNSLTGLIASNYDNNQSREIYELAAYIRRRILELGAKS